VVKTGSVYEYQYAIADYQGNTRIVFSSVTPSPSESLAGFDANDQTDEYGDINWSNVVTNTSANVTSGGSLVLRMNQSYPVALTKSGELIRGWVNYFKVSNAKNIMEKLYTPIRVTVLGR
jgi:hypothetical protein